MITISWVIRNKETKQVIFETFNQTIVQELNTAKYEALPIEEYLGKLNAEIRRKDLAALESEVGQHDSRG